MDASWIIRNRKYNLMPLHLNPIVGDDMESCIAPESVVRIGITISSHADKSTHFSRLGHQFSPQSVAGLAFTQRQLALNSQLSRHDVNGSNDSSDTESIASKQDTSCDSVSSSDNEQFPSSSNHFTGYEQNAQSVDLSSSLPSNNGHILVSSSIPISQLLARPKKKKLKCIVENCSRYRHRGGCCVAHGGGTYCKIEGCTKHVSTKGLCIRHGGIRYCKFENCKKRCSGTFCRDHGGGKKCLNKGCTNFSQTKGLCGAHGGGYYCKIEGCSKRRARRGVCTAHGGGAYCQIEDCQRAILRGGRCCIHQ